MPDSVKRFLIEWLLIPASHSLMSSISNSLLLYMRRRVLTKCSGSSEHGAIDASAFLVAGVRYQSEETKAGNNQASFEVLAVV